MKVATSSRNPDVLVAPSGGRATRMVRTSSGEQIASHIRRMIFEGELRPGMRVPQDAIARDLGVSRIPVREALIVLEREGWVTIEMHRGAFIDALDAQAVQDHYELFGLIYGFAARRALSRSSPDLAERLADIQRRFARERDPAQMQALSIAFHGAIVEVAASPRINVALRAMSALVPGNFFAEVPDAAEVEKRGLAAIVRAMAGRDGDKAAAEYARMMRRVGDKVVRLFKDRGLFESAAITA